MKIEKQQELQADLQTIAHKYDLHHWGFCGEGKDCMFIGMLEQKQTQGGYMLSVLNIGRLWQYARQTCRGLLDSYERLP